MGEWKHILECMTFTVVTQRRRCPATSRILSKDISMPILGTRSTGENWQLSGCHTHLVILAMVISATRMKFSAGESCAPLGTATGPVKPSLPWSQYHTPTGCGCQQQRITQGGSTAPTLGWNLAPPLGMGLWKETQPLTGVTGPWWPSAQPCSRLAPRHPSPSMAALGILLRTIPTHFSHWPSSHHGSSLTGVPL